MRFTGVRSYPIPVWLLGLSLIFACANFSHAVIETYQFSDPALQVRYKQLSAELRCPKCQNQNIADSDAPIARDLRKLLHRQLEAGSSNEEIMQYMVERYGEFVLYRPRFEGVTLILWLFPIGLLAAAGLMVYRVVGSAGRNRTEPAGAEEGEDFETVLAQKFDSASKPENKS